MKSYSKSTSIAAYSIRRRVSKAAFGWIAAGCIVTTATAQSTERAVFVVNNVSDEISSFTLDDDGILEFVGNYTVADNPQSMSISPDGRFLAVGHAGQSTTVEVLTILRVNDDASLSDFIITTTPDSPLDCQWVSPTILTVLETDFGDSMLHSYSLDETNGILSLVDSIFIGGFSTQLTVHPNGNIIFANDSFGDRVLTFHIDSSGMLSAINSEITSPLFPLDLGISNDGSRLYSACGISGDSSSVLGFDVDGSGGIKQTEVNTSPGDSPAHVVVSSDDQLAFVGHGRDATVRSFSINAVTGELTPTGFFFDVGSQGTLGDIAVLDDLLIVTDESTVSDGIAGTYSFRINSDGSLTKLGEAANVGGVRPETIAVWGGVEEPELATLVDFDVTFGTLLNGGLTELIVSDDQLLRARSSFGFLSSEPNVMTFEIGAETTVQLPSLIDLVIESRINNPGGSARVRLRNFISNALEEVDSYAIGTTESIQTIDDVSAVDRVRPSDGRIELSIKHVVIATFSLSGFVSSFDEVRVSVE